jgi:hypothetical protein
MEERRQARSALGDISNITTQTDNESLMREERNRKQREYRARKRDEETMEQREERNRKRREYYARKKAEETHGNLFQLLQLLFVCSLFFQLSN